MRKRLSCFLLALAMLVMVCPTRAEASSNIDLSRVKFSSGSEKLVFEFGDIQIEGEVHQKVPFTQGEINRFVKETLKEQGLTELDIKEANGKVEKARRASEFTKEDMERIKQNLLTTAEVTPVPEDAVTVFKVIDKYLSTTSWDDIGTASADLLEQSMTDQVKDTASGFVDRAGELGENVNLANEWMGALSSIISFCEMLADEQAHSRQKWQDIANGAEAKRLLNRFYEALQDKIDRYKRKSDQEGWAIDFNQAPGRRVFTFFSVGNNFQDWYLDMNMEQKSTNEFGSIAGEYEGHFTIRAANNMKEGFQKYTDAVLRHLDSKGVLGSGLKAYISQMSGAGFPTSFTPGAAGEAYIDRTISGSCEAAIAESGEITLSLHEDNDKTEVNISGVTSDLTTTIQENGVNAKIIITFELYASDEELKVKGTMTDSFGSAYGHGFSYSEGLGAGGKAGWDENIWKPWDGTKKTLKLAGE
ncbi:MAG TPA: hypothetical protein DD738_11025 [Ruminiclostridium sp.]|nr:hypothetical protein [Ruminiclostridium sp.]